MGTIMENHETLVRRTRDLGRTCTVKISLILPFVLATAALPFAGLSAAAGEPAGEHGQGSNSRYLYVWAGHADHTIPDFLAVIDFDEDSPAYGRVISRAPLPGPGATFNEPHHMHLSADGLILGCGGLLSVLSGQPGIFFFDTSVPRKPRFLFSTSDRLSSITDDFYPLPQGGFLVTQMGSANGDAPGRVVEFDRKLRQVGSWPSSPPTDGFNPHGISVRPEFNLMMTCDFILPDSTLNVFAGPPLLRNTIRVWDFKERKIRRTIRAPEAVGTMDVKLIPGDLRGRAYTAGMFNGLIYLVDPLAGSATPAFDTSTQGGMPQVLQVTRDGSRLLTGLFQTGRILMLDTTNRSKLRQVAALNLGAGAGPHNIMLTDDDTRLIVTDYFLDQDNFPFANPGKVRLGGDCKIHVLKVTPNSLKLDTRFQLDFSTAFSTGPARPHGIAVR
jgi:DNA-binding beta-propeller fold protein YncE